MGIAQFSPNHALVLTEVGEDGLEWRPAITSGANGDKAGAPTLEVDPRGDMELEFATNIRCEVSNIPL